MRDLPDEKKFRLRPGHLLILIDLAVIAGLFVAGGRLYMDQRGVKVIARVEQQKADQEAEGLLRIQEADSVVAATEVRLSEALADSAAGIEDLRNLRAELDTRIDEVQRLSQGIYRLSDVVLDMRKKAESAVRQSVRDQENVENRVAEVDSLKVTERATRAKWVDTQAEREDAQQALLAAQAGERFDPKGRFPAKTGLLVRRDIGDELDTTNLLLEHVLVKRGRNDFGLSLGWGLGGDESTSNKEVGLVFSRSLVHRRIGLDVGAGFAQLTRVAGDDDAGAYASAGLRLSPFYKERIHLGLGAKAFQDEVVPFLGLSLGRR